MTAAPNDSSESSQDNGTDTRFLPRVVVAYRLLEERRASTERLRGLIERTERVKLLPVAGRRWLLERLEQRLGEAQAVLDEIAAGVDEPASALGRLEEVLHFVDWSVAGSAITELEAQDLEQEAAIRALTEDLGTYRLWFDRYRRELAGAVDAGIELPLSPEHEEALAEMIGKVRQADQDAARGRFDTVTVALSTIRRSLQSHGLWEASAFDELIGRIAARRDEVEQREVVMTRRAELFLIAAPHTGPGGKPVARAGAPIEYRVLLRRPNFEASQESNLHDTMQIDEEDRQQFRATIDDIAEAATGGARGAAGGMPVPAATEPLRGIAVRTPRSSLEHPAERLERVGRLMYSLLIPDAMQRLIDETRCPLTITSNDLELPWELMHDGDDFLCLKRPFARMPVGQTFPRRSRRAMPATRASWNVLLIHSDPDGSIEDAGKEIDEISETLKQLPVRVNTKILSGKDATGELLTQHLSSGQYDVIHYAGHADFDLVDPTKSFLLLHGKQRFFADRIQRVLEGRPIIFLNACETSRTQNEGVGVSTSGIVARAQGLASAFVYGGAQACVGTLWPVFDDTARALAASFYTRLLNRQRVGEALCDARAMSHTMRGDQLTWAAYALYGDPLYRLREGAPASDVPKGIGTA